MPEIKITLILCVLSINTTTPLLRYLLNTLYSVKTMELSEIQMYLRTVARSFGKISHTVLVL